MTEHDPRLEWLLHGDPAVVWQTERDLCGRSARTWSKHRGDVARRGWGRRLLEHRAPDGTWGGGLYNPKWTSTFYSLRLLTQLGLPPRHRPARSSCRLLLDRGVTDSAGVSLWTSPSTDTCVTAMLLSMACYFGFAADARAARMLEWLLGEQMRDGGWNCSKHRGATHSSFHTTISTLEAIAAYREENGASVEIDDAARAGREFFLDHQLYRSSRTGKIVRPSFAQLSFPPRWYFDVLRGLEYFRSSGAEWDDRLSDAVVVVERRRRPDGLWRAENKHPGKVFFELEPARHPSRVNTLRALRVLRWARESATGPARARARRVCSRDP